MSTIFISHSHTEGTIAEGTEKGDGAAEVLKRYGFRWAPSLGCFIIRGSRDRAARRVAINTAAEQLRAAGHTVSVAIDDTVRDTATVRAAQHERLEDRRDALAAKGHKLEATAEALHRASGAMVEHLPLGQPVAPGRKGRAHRKTLDRSVDTAIRGALTAQEAARLPARVEGSRSQEAYRERPDVTARRVQRLEADLRALDRKLAGLQSGDHRDQCEAERAVLSERIAYDRDQLEQARADGRFGRYTRENVHKDDPVRIRGEWRQVVRASAKSVSVATGYSWTDRYGYEEITDLRCTHADRAAAPRAEGTQS
ncbi:DUF3560 domain-containing protein [Streptomyces sp. SID14478]|uniref:DUF3560 domain-containing protein n=1 Tax=Streptomyces sp. SID14478 TaxID=2706073 RepID=UPI0013D93B41|nr:DUF3560 domain-containing protein [Streptomyces sp. SID14478]NEB76004.1 DUF3560 domain-containing protein [Streptomyces sp. SID14478]